GCALFQTYPDGTRKPIGYWSRSLTSAEKNYSVTEKECLAVVYALLTLRPYLIMEKFTVHTDHASLRWLMTITDPSGRLMRWRLRLSEYDFDAQYKKGLKNCQADALSRLPTNGETSIDIDADIPCLLAEVFHQPIEFHGGHSSHCSSRSCAHAQGDIPDPLCDDDNYESDPDYSVKSEHGVELFAMLDEQASPTTNVKQITLEELLHAQLRDPSCAQIRSRLNGGGGATFFA
ncbi:MAG: Ty3/Gypsy family RNase HI domain-containing protein, partial [Sphaerochaetaceae bacterium]